MPNLDPLLTIFTAPKPFTDPHISLIQSNAIRSWLHLGDEVSVLIIGDEPGLAEFAHQAGVLQMSDVARNDQGTPLVSSIFALARQASSSPLMAYVNADILLTSQLVSTASQVFCELKKFLIIGQRYDLSVKQPVEFTTNWEASLMAEVQEHGRLHPSAGSDFFIFPRTCFTDIPRFAIGRAGWDNWMIYDARMQHLPTIDATSAITAIHQDHDYSHLPNGVAHYHLPESFENLRLAGGPRTVFTLKDADYRFENGVVLPIARSPAKIMREIEIFPLVRLRTRTLADIFFTIFHPIKGVKELRGRLAYKLSRTRGAHA